MALFEIAGADGLIPFKQLRGGADLYESEIEALLWENLQDLTDEVLFPVKRQAPISGGGRPDIVALDRSGAVVVIEVKRAVDRSQLAQCLEYAGWARTTNLDEIAAFYHRGPQAFWSEWMEFTETEQPLVVNRNPQLIVVARNFNDRTASAVEFLRQNSVPITVLRMSLYEDSNGRRFLDSSIEGEGVVSQSPSALATAPEKAGRSRASFQVSLADLLGAGLLTAGERLEWPRPRSGQTLYCTVEDDGRLALPDATVVGSPSAAASHAAGTGSFDGWECWRSPQRAGRTLRELRQELLDDSGSADEVTSEGRPRP